MSTDRSREALGRFLDYLGEKGLLAPATAQTRKVSAMKVLEILSPEEAKDVTVLDIAEISKRFANLKGRNYNPSSMNTYRSRLKTALTDFGSYLENPLSFKISTQTRDVSTKVRKDDADRNKGDRPEVQPEQTRPVAPAMPGMNVMPIPVRADLTILIHGLPHDLTEAEAKKISGVINALASG